MSVFAEFRAPRTVYPLGPALVDHPDVTADVERIVPVGGSTHYAWLTGEGRDAVVDALRETPSVDGVTVVDALPDRVLVRFGWESHESPIFRIARMVDATPIGAYGTHDGWTLQFRFVGQDALASFHEESRARGIPLELRQSYDADGVSGDGGFGLTDTQTETLAVAFEAGYFEVPRRITLSELADRLGVSEQAVSERLRRGLFSLLTATGFDSDADGSTERDATDGSSLPD